MADVKEAKKGVLSRNNVDVRNQVLFKSMKMMTVQLTLNQSPCYWLAV